MLSHVLPGLILVIFLGVWICKFNQWDSLTHVTLVPFWMWALLGIFVSIVPAILVRNRFSLFVFWVWVFTAVISSAEAHGLFRKLIDSARNYHSGVTPRDPKGLIRLVSINCNGSLDAAREAFDFDADLFFFQNAPEEQHIEQLAFRLFGLDGDYVQSDSTAILGLGQFVTFAEDDYSTAIHGRFKHLDGTLLDLTNVQLAPSIPTIKIWDEEAREHLEQARIKNRKSIRRFIGDYPRDNHQPVRIIAGDFATPPGDDIFRPLKKAGLRDAFRLSGRGTGNTYPEKIPVLRLNQVWISQDATLLKTRTVRSKHSEHRILICEFLVNR